MKKIIIFLSLFISTSALAAQVDPLWRLQRAMMRPSLGIGEMMGVDRALGVEEEALIEVFVKTSDTALTAARIRNCGGKVRTITRTIITAALPASVLESEAEGWTEAEYIEAAKPMSPHNDLADADTGVTTAEAGTDLPYGFDGTGVIIGIIDSGIDLTHPAFKSSDDGKTRVLYLWDQNDTTGTGPSEIIDTYGSEYMQAQINAGTVPEEDTDGHGTHVAGTAGGRDSVYSGVAPKASFIIVKYDFTSSETDAVNYIFKKATALGMPAVINMSLGSDFGARDGTSVEEQALDELVDESSGRAIVVSAGNSGSTSYTYNDTQYNGYGHIDYGVTNSDGTYFKIYRNEYDVDAAIDIWGPQACNVSISLGLWDSSGLLSFTDWITSGNTDSGILSSFVTYEIDRSETANTQNNKWHSTLYLDVGSDYDYGSYYFDIVFRPVSGMCTSFDAWTYPDSTTFFTNGSDVIDGTQYHSGDNNSTVTVPSTAANVISVGAYTTRKEWEDSSGVTQPSDPNERDLLTVNDIAYFSSRGPALDEDQQGYKPNITAPGAYLISALSANCDSDPVNTYCPSTSKIDVNHLAMAGTSMASPHVAGIVALMLQAYPSLTYSEIKDYLQNTARSATPNTDWGYGKVDASAAVKAVVADHPSADEGNLTVSGVTVGETDNDYTTKNIVVEFPRAVETTTLTPQNLYVAEMSTTSASLSESTAYDPSRCDPGNAVASTVALNGSQTAEITLDEAMGLGDFAVCLTPNVKDTSNTTFWGKTVQFGTSLPNTGCSLVRSADSGSSQPFIILFTLVVILSVTRLKNIFGERELCLGGFSYGKKKF